MTTGLSGAVFSAVAVFTEPRILTQLARVARLFETSLCQERTTGFFLCLFQVIQACFVVAPSSAISGWIGKWI